MYGGIGASGEIFCGRTTRPGNKAFRVPACRTCEEYQMIGLQEEKEGFPHGHLEMTLLKIAVVSCVFYILATCPHSCCEGWVYTV